MPAMIIGFAKKKPGMGEEENEDEGMDSEMEDSSEGSNLVELGAAVKQAIKTGTDKDFTEALQEFVKQCCGGDE